MAEWFDSILARLREFLDAAPWQNLTSDPAWKAFLDSATTPAGMALVATTVAALIFGVLLGMAFGRRRQSRHMQAPPLEMLPPPQKASGTPARDALQRVLEEQGLSGAPLNTRLRAFDGTLGVVRETLKSLAEGHSETSPLVAAAERCLDGGDLAGAISLLDQTRGRLVAMARISSGLAENQRSQAVRTAILAGDLEMALRHYEAAARHFGRAAEYVQADGSDGIAPILTKQGTALFRAGNHQEAAVIMENAIRMTGNEVGADHPDLALALSRQAAIRSAMGDEEGAEKLYRRALAIDEKALGKDHPKVAGDLNNLAQLLRRSGRLEDSEPLFRRVLEIRRKAFGPDHRAVRQATRNYAAILRSLNRRRESNAVLARAAVARREAAGR
ncbi:MAG: tetratricopeptide repeat protein [Rhodospirillales bacterium]|nr:tetratricopeptide repeat protein [Rhodospirillales bacterium]